MMVYKRRNLVLQLLKLWKIEFSTEDKKEELELAVYRLYYASL